MTGKCPQCLELYTVHVGRGDKLANHTCPKCQVPLVGRNAGTAKGKYLCPITGYVYVLGQRAIALDQPHRLVFQAGQDWLRPHEHRTEPTTMERRQLDRVDDKILGTGCVVADEFDPRQYNEGDAAVREWLGSRACLRLVPVDDAGDPAEWLVNEPLKYRKCAGCNARLIEVPERRIDETWTPARRFYTRRAARHEVAPGPHAAGTFACMECDPR
jgi:hypothetical protein